jgi:PPOX class probable F420-dependent enzyme
MAVSLTMTETEREQFLAAPRVGVLSVAAGERGPITVPVWYDYQPGGTVSVITGRSTRKALAIQAAGRMSLCVQDEQPPYRYVSVEGPVVTGEPGPSDRLGMARRYLGTEGGDQFVAANPDPGGEMIVLRMSPERWTAQDFGKFSG